MSKDKLSPEGEVIAAYGAAMVAAFQVLLNCLEENEAVHPGQFPEALRVYMEMVKSKKGDMNDMTLAVLHDFRMATFELIAHASDSERNARRGEIGRSDHINDYSIKQRRHSDLNCEKRGNFLQQMSTASKVGWLVAAKILRLARSTMSKGPDPPTVS